MELVCYELVGTYLKEVNICFVCVCYVVSMTLGDRLPFNIPAYQVN